MEEQRGQLQERITVLGMLIILLKRKRLIAGATAGTLVLAVLVSLLMPKAYRAEARILPPEQQSAGAAAQLFTQLGALGLPRPSSASRTTGDLYVGLLKSRTLLDRIVDRFNLMDNYGVAFRADARQRLLKNLTIQDDKKSGIILIGVEDNDPTRSADLTNAFVEELRNRTHYIAVSEASQRRLFFEEQLKSIKDALLRSEESLKGFQERTGAIEMKEQTKALIDTVSQLRAQIAAREVQLKVLRTYSTPQNPDLQKAEEELRAMQEQLIKLETKGDQGRNSVMPIGRIPEAGTGYIRKLRDLKYYETLYELLAKQYEMAKMDEARDAAVIQVIDSAVPPEKRIRPQRTTMVLAAGCTSLLLSVLAAFILERRERFLQDPANREHLRNLKAYAETGLVQGALPRWWKWMRKAGGKQDVE